MQEPAIENLDYLRQLIAEIRSSYDDMERLRMLYGTGMGTDALQQEDR
jgi:hypothetical protein